MVLPSSILISIWPLPHAKAEDADVVNATRARAKTIFLIMIPP